jgi:mono/diheme cytochrome c family protein
VKPTALLGFALLGAAVLLSGCRGQTSRKPPLFILHGMEFQPRFNAFEGNAFYADGRNMRTPPAGTVAQGLLKDDDAFYHGGDSTQPVRTSPVPVTAALLERGQERFNIYCSPCHARTGLGNGMVVQRGFLPPPSLLEERIVQLPDGQIFQVITKGLRNMPSYAKQIPESDRWAIVSYIRALQISQR